MTDLHLEALENALNSLPKLYAGPGGVAGVMKDGKLIASRAWGYSNLEEAVPMTAATRLPICSISKQFTCQVLLAEFPDPAKLDGKISQYLPSFKGQLPTTRQLCDNQSGLRDYWALTVLQGAMAEQEFRREDALPLLARMKTGHFPPGSAYSYCNCNFRILSEMLEAETGTDLETLYQRHIFTPAGMKTAVLTADTRHPADGVVAYEGNDGCGYLPADNGIYWIGDAGLSASLDDMLAYEAWIDATRDDPFSLYQRASVQPSFADGKLALYGYGLARHQIGGEEFAGHGGALRGFRSFRMYSKATRLSVVVMFNHTVDAYGAAKFLAEAAMGITHAPAPIVPEGWDGQWLADDGLVVRLKSGRRNVTMRYMTGPETLNLAEDGSLRSADVVLRREGETLTMQRIKDNTAPKLTPLPIVNAANGEELAGRYFSEELDAEMLIEAKDGGVYARFEGMLGKGRMERIYPSGRDVWQMATRRSMDAPAPGDWSLVIARDEAGAITGFTLGCWLARGVGYKRL